MNDRKRAWQILHTEVRRRALDEMGKPFDEDAWDAWCRQLPAIVRAADSNMELIIQLAGFGATFAIMQREPQRALALADQIGVSVMQEPDEAEVDDEL